jgi:hypothetical protein
MENTEINEENILSFYICIIFAIILIIFIIILFTAYIYYIKLYSKVYDNITKEKCIESNYTYKQGGLVGLDSSYCYEINKGEKIMHVLNNLCVKSNLELDKDNCYFYRS